MWMRTSLQFRLYLFAVSAVSLEAICGFLGEIFDEIWHFASTLELEITKSGTCEKSYRAKYAKHDYVLCE